MMIVMHGVAHPWQCDVFGHLTTRFYTALFDDASYHFLHRLFGWQGASDGNIGMVDVKHTVNFKNEVRAGELLEIQARLIKIGGKSMTVSYEMVSLKDATTAATQETVMVLFDLKKRVALAFPDELREIANRHL